MLCLYSQFKSQTWFLLKQLSCAEPNRIASNFVAFVQWNSRTFQPEGLSQLLTDSLMSVLSVIAAAGIHKSTSRMFNLEIFHNWPNNVSWEISPDQRNVLDIDMLWSPAAAITLHNSSTSSLSLSYCSALSLLMQLLIDFLVFHTSDSPNAFSLFLPSTAGQFCLRCPRGVSSVGRGGRWW